MCAGCGKKRMMRDAAAMKSQGQTMGRRSPVQLAEAVAGMAATV
jgi:hypothetical protein